MQLTIVFRHMEPSQAVKAHIEQKMNKLSRFFPKEPVKIHVVICHEKIRYCVEATATAGHFSLTCVEEAATSTTAIDQLTHKLERQFCRHKEKVKDHKVHRPVESASVTVEQQV